MNKVLELFGEPTATHAHDWAATCKKSWCPYLDRVCLKNRKSRPDILIGTCTVAYGTNTSPIIICPHRLLQRKQIFSDCLQMLTLHEPGNEIHVVPEIAVPGGSVDYFLVSARKGKVRDFVGIELQTLDTTGTVWPARQRFLKSVGLKVIRGDIAGTRTFGMNWKMTAKTTLVQLHHKVRTFEHLSKRLVLVVQDCFLEYMQRNFDFGHMTDPRLGDPMHIHAYSATASDSGITLELARRVSTDADGIARCLGM